ncbi:MAG: hypothetical protein LBV67_07155 [Streptococcaceae bacterium]|jgi:hypothetical protein|nr:hypothetical protein [Streptococcaceae bacterium]
MQEEKLNFGDYFKIAFDEMKVEVTAVTDICQVKTDITIDAATLDEHIFEPKYLLKTRVEVNEMTDLDETDLKNVTKVLNEAKKLLKFMEDNTKNFLEKVVPELREKALAKQTKEQSHD